SFVPCAEQRSWRWLTRTRVELKRRVGMIRSQVEGLLEEAGIKLSATVSDVFGASGWAMLEGRAAGGREGARCAARGAGCAARDKKEALQEALAGHCNATTRLLLSQCLEQVRLLQRHIAEIGSELNRNLRDHLGTLQRLSQVPGVELAAAQELVAEIGPGASA